MTQQHHLIAFGLNHKTSPLDLRERFQLMDPSHQDPSSYLCHLTQQAGLGEAMILNTCNRSEIYGISSDPRHLLPWLAKRQTIGEDHLRAHTYLYHEQDAMRHIMRVACGLDSMLVGEPQIFGQMKTAYRQACQAGTVGHGLHPFFTTNL